MNSSELKIDLKKQCTYGTAFLLFIINWKCQSGKENVNIDKKYSNHGKDILCYCKYEILIQRRIHYGEKIIYLGIGNRRASRQNV